jgi:hypothetical protein
MPLLTELGWNEDTLCYRHVAPNGAVPQSQDSIPPEAAKNAGMVANMLLKEWLPRFETRHGAFME